ncbi:MAG: ABC transporter substrate-binding protein [Lachnospiraceae bacterium]|nr:ABC transporter substrate-binding protein [Lachnospiraceae bacterium]
MMKKRLAAAGLAAAMCLGAFTGCSKSSSEETKATNESGSKEASTGTDALTGTLKIGLIGPLTGGAAIYGNAVKNGATIAVNEINAKGGVTFELLSEDDEHDGEKSVNAYGALLDKKVQVICGTVTTTPCIAVAPKAYEDRVFMLTPSASSTKVTADNDNVFQLCFSDPNQGSASAQYISDHKLATKIAIIYNNSDAYSTGIYQTFKAKAEELKLDIVSTTTFTDETANDFSVQIADAQKAGADLVFLPIYYTPASLILKQAKDAGYAPTFFGVDGMDGILDIEGFDKKLAEGVILLTPFSADATDDRTKNFVSTFDKDYKETPSQFAADGYDVIYTFYDALTYYAKKNGGLDVTGKSEKDLCEILISVLTDTGFSTNGLTGEKMQWSKEGEVDKAPKAVVIKEGVYVGL